MDTARNQDLSMNQDKRFIRYIEDIHKHARIAIYGAGDYGLSLLDALRQQRPDIQVMCVADTFKTGNIHGLDIIGPDELAKRKAEFDFVIIASDFFSDQIAATLIALDITNFRYLHPLFNSHDIDLDESSCSKINHQTLYAFYDLGNNNANFEFLNYLFLAEFTRMKQGFPFLHMVIVPPPEDMLKQPGKKYETGEVLTSWRQKGWMVKNVLLPCCWMMNPDMHITVCTNRQEAWNIQHGLGNNVFPANYSVNSPVGACSIRQVRQAVESGGMLPSLRACPEALNHVQQWIDQHSHGRKAVTITLRETFDSMEERNSDLDNWIKFADSIDQEKFCTIFLRDTFRALGPPLPQLKNHLVFHEAPWNLELRMALYELSFLNLFVANGPAHLCMFNRKTKCLIFNRMSTNMFAMSEAYFKAENLPVGSQWPHTTDFQQLVWEEDSSEVIQKHFKRMCKKIEQDTDKFRKMGVH